jgi:hypothetical protein
MALCSVLSKICCDLIVQYRTKTESVKKISVEIRKKAYSSFDLAGHLPDFVDICNLAIIYTEFYLIPFLTFAYNKYFTSGYLFYLICCQLNNLITSIHSCINQHINYRKCV